MKKGASFLSFVSAFLFISSFISCKKDSTSRDVIFNIAPTIGYMTPRPPGTGPANIPGMKAVEKGKTDTTLLSLERIEGFTYVEGYKYIIKVRISQIDNPPADGYSDNYKLIEIISKEKED